MDKRIDLFIKWFEKKHPLHDKTSSVLIYENEEDTYENIADDFSTMLTQYHSSAEKQKYGNVIIGFGYAIGSIISHNKNLTITHQHRYKDTPVWALNVNTTLNISAENIFYSNGFDKNDEIDENDFKDTEIGEYLKWLINPNGNLEIATDVFKRITSPMIKAVADRMTSKSKKNIKIAIPPFSAELDNPNWQILFKDLRLQNTNVEILPTSFLYCPKENERIYVIWKHSWFFDDCYIVEAIELSNNGEPIDIATYAFLDSNPENYYVLKAIDYAKFSIDNSVAYEQSTIEPIIFSSPILVEPKLQISNGLLAFLGTHSPSFCWEFYSLINGNNETTIDTDISSLMEKKQSLQVATLCGKLCNENNMVNIALSDMVSAGMALENKKIFKRTTMGNRSNEESLGTSTTILPKQEINFAKLPSNYFLFTWKYQKICFGKDDYTKKSFKDKLKQYKDNGDIDSILGILIAYFSPNATTDRIAEELLYNFGISATPTARFVAELFWYLSTNPSFIIDKKSEEIQEFDNQ